MLLPQAALCFYLKTQHNDLQSKVCKPKASVFSVCFWASKKEDRNDE